MRICSFLTLLASLAAHLPADDLATLSPEQAVVVSSYVKWSEVNAGVSTQPRRAWVEPTAARTTFHLEGPGSQSWWFQWANKVDVSRYPILRLKYRAVDVFDAELAALRVRFKNPAKYPTVTLRTCAELNDDGNIHEWVTDLRKSTSIESAIDVIQIGIAATEGRHAQLEVLGLWFEAAEDQVNEKVAESPASKIRILKPDGQPASGVRIISNPQRANWSRVAVTDDDGQATVPSIGEPAGRRTLKIVADGMVPILVREDRARGGKGGLPAEIRLRPAQVYSGIVRNADGQPVQDARVSVSLFHDGADDARLSYQRWGTTFTEKNGHWQTPPMDSIGRGNIVVSHPDYVKLKESVERQELQGQSLTLDRGHRLEATIVDEHGQPISDATIHLNGYRSDEKFTTNSAGQLSIPKIGTGKVAFFISASGYSPIVQNEKVDKDATELIFELKPAKDLIVRVMDQNGKPVPSPSISLGYFRNQLWPMHGSRGGEDGRIVWKDAPSEEVKYHIGAAGYATAEASLTANGNEHVVTLYPLLRVSGEVTDAVTGKPVQQFQVVPVHVFRPDFLYVNRGEPIDGADGRYSFTFSRTDIEHRVRIESPGYRTAISEPYKIGQPNPTCDFQLQPAPAAEGRIVDATGSAIVAAKVFLATPTQEADLYQHVDSSDNFRRITDNNGEFSFPAQYEPYTIVVIHDRGYAEIALQPDQVPGEMQLHSWASVKGTLYQSGKPVPNAEINLWPLRPRFGDLPYLNDKFRSKTDENGHFKFSQIPPVRSKLFADLSVWNDSPITSSQSVPLDIQPGQHLNIDLGHDGIDVTGQVALKDAIGREFDFTYALNWLVRKSPGVEPLPAVSANGFDISKGWDPSLRSTNEGQAYLGTLHNYFVKLDPDGSLLITGVPPGDYELALHLYEPPDG